MNRLSTALNTSLSGLTLASRMTQTISNNVANVLTEGYASRQVIPSSRSLGGNGLGVTIASIQRNSDPFLLAERRAADGQLAVANTRADFYNQIETAIGLPGDIGSLTQKLAEFSGSLIESASRPDSDARLQSVINTANSLVGKINDASSRVQSLRMQADQEIGQIVNFVNDTLAKISKLNVPNVRARNNEEQYLDILDQRQILVNQLSELIPVRELQRENGTVALFTPGGSILLDGSPSILSFQAAGQITPHMSIETSTLSGLMINDKVVGTDVEAGKIAGGRLSALFELRDVQAKIVQEKLDVIARDLVERFQDANVDPTISPGGAGLFTDQGAPFVSSNEVGLSARLSTNNAVDPSKGGELWRLRSGLNASMGGDAGDSTLLNAMLGALDQSKTVPSGGYSAEHSTFSLAGEISSELAVLNANFISDQTFANARLSTLASAESANGVDTDHEMQKLLLVEQAYAANAKVISTIDELIETLLRM